MAGPIVRYGAIEQQMRQRSHTAEKFACGVMFFCLGMAKKIVIANPLAQVSDAAFAGGSLDLFDAWYGIVAYAYQIYFDFSGYSDLASGLALMMGFVLMQNWEIVPMPATSASDGVGRVAEESMAAPLLIKATVVATSRVFTPFSIPYKDFLTYIKLHVDRVFEGATRDDQMIAVFWGMKDNVLLPAADYHAGQRLRLKAVPLKKAPSNLQSVRRVDESWRLGASRAHSQVW
jgi:hypothetical protein